MEEMQISLISVVERNGSVVARARADAEQAWIWVEVRFSAQLNATQADLWHLGYDYVLRYLDPA